MYATFRNPRGFCDGTKAQLCFLTQTLQDFLGSFPYIKLHRSLMNVHQGTILDLALSRRVFLWVALIPLPTSSVCPALRCYPCPLAIGVEIPDQRHRL